MTQSEEKFAKLYNPYKTEIKDLTDLELRARREELADIAFSARVYLSAVDHTLSERKPKGPQGFSRSVNVDDTTSEAINAVKQRQKNMTQAEKIASSLSKVPGMDPKFIEKLMSSRNLLDATQNRVQNHTKPAVPGTISEDKSTSGDGHGGNSKPFVNPFKKGE